MSTESLFSECSACKKSFLKSENVCPQCGSKRKKFSTIQIGVGIIASLFLIGWLNSPKEDGVTSSASVNQEQKKPQSQAELKEIIASQVALDYTWKKGGFGSIMEADFRVKNNSDHSIKDIEIQCNHYAKSGTKVDSNSRTMYDVIGPNSIQSYQDFNMGFIHDQANTTSCLVKKFSLTSAR